MTKTEVLKLGSFPSFFFDSLVSEAPDIHVDYKKVKLVWNCPKHGNYEKLISNFLRGERCPKCSRENTRAEKRLSLYPQWFIDDLEGSPDKEAVLSGRVGHHDYMQWYCKFHGWHKAQLSKILKGDTCPKCSSLASSQKDKVFPQWFIDDLEGSPDKEAVLSKKVNFDNKVTFVCKIHGKYEQSIRSHLKYKRCPICSQKLKHQSLSKDKRRNNPFPESMLLELREDFRKKALLGDLHLKDVAVFICREHGEYEQRVDKHFTSGHGCPICGSLNCSKFMQKSKRCKNPFPQWFINDLEGSPDKEAVLSGTLRVRDKAHFVCKVHGLYYQQIDGHLNMGYGCPTCARNKTTSSIEDEIRDYFTEREIKVFQSFRNLISTEITRPMELDLYFPDYNLAVEVNGLYWHSFETLTKRPHSWDFSADYYHLYKTIACEKLGIQLIHVFEDDYLQNRDKIMKLLESKMGILSRHKVFARSCNLVITDDSSIFENNHIQGPGQGIIFALEYEGRILSAIQVKEAPSNVVDTGSHILDRYASVSDTFVVGGIEKLLKNAERQLSIKRWVSYADLTVSDGSLYKRLGWIEVQRSKPDYKYIWKGRRVHKFNFRIKRFKNDPDFLYQEGLTEFQLAELNGIRRIYDCGKIKYAKDVE